MHARANWLSLLVAASCAIGFAADAHADVSKKVIKALKGQLIISTEPVSPGGTDKETVAAYKAAKLKEVTGEPNGDDVQEWTFHYTAFLKKKAPSATLELDFYDGKDLKGNPGLQGVDTTAPVLEGDITISENDGPTKGHKYTVKLVATVNNKDIVLASTTLTMK